MGPVKRGTSSKTMKKFVPVDVTTSKRTPLEVPEIVEHVTTFLSNSDLLTCTLLNKTWEGEARKKLLKNVLLDFSLPEVKNGFEGFQDVKEVNNDFLQNVTSYIQAMKPRGAYHSKLRIGEIKSVHESNVLLYLITRKVRGTWPIFPGKWTSYFLEIITTGVNGPEGKKWYNALKSPPAGYLEEQMALLVLSWLIGLRVKELSMIWPSPIDVAYFCEVVTVPLDEEDFDQDDDFSPNDPRLASLKTKLPAGFVLPSVKRLIIKFNYDEGSECASGVIQKKVQAGLARSILELCPNMESLHVDSYGKRFGKEIARDASRFAKLGEVNFPPGDDPQVGILSLPLPLRVIHVNFGMTSGLRGMQKIFEKFSNTLEYFKMGIEMMLWETVDPQDRQSGMKRSTILVPRMPKLKKIHISVGMSLIISTKKQRAKSGVFCRPGHDFVFDTAAGDQKIDYDLQFPSLTTIVIRGERRGDRYKHEVLYDFFTPQVDPPCTTVRYLDIVYPPENKVFLERNPDCATGCDCWI